MSLWNRIFRTKQISENELARRMGEKYVPTKAVLDMTEDERLQYWRRSRELTDFEKRMRCMEELVNAGFVPAYTTIFDTIFERAEEDKTRVPLDKLNYWAQRAVNAGHISGHYYLGMIYETPEYLQQDYETHIQRAWQEYLLAMEVENQSAAHRLIWWWTHEVKNPQSTDEENSEATAYLRETMRNSLKPEINRLKEQNDERTCCAFGQMYLYGILFKQNLAMAKSYFQRLADANRQFGYDMLANPLFDEDDEDDEE